MLFRYVLQLYTSMCQRAVFLDKKLSYRGGTARRDILVSLCYVSRNMEIRKVSISKRDFDGHLTVFNN